MTSSESAFHRPSYGGPVLRMINAVQPFTAAYAHSLELIARAQLGGALKDNTRITGEPFNAVAFTAKSLLAITLPTLLLWYANKDKEWYKAAPDWQKDNGLLVRVGGDGPDGHTIFWKFPPVISLLYGGIPRRIAESVVDQDPHAFDNMMTSIGTSLLPPGGLLSYNVFLPFIEHMANHSFFRNQPLVTDGEAHRLGPEQFNQYSTQLGKNISQMLNDSPLRMQLAPAVIDNYIKDWGGTLGSDLLRLSDNLSNAVNPDKPASHLEDWPLFAGFMSRFPAANAAPIAAFRDQVKQMDQVHGSLVTAIQEGNLDRFKQIVEGNPTAALIHALRLQGEPHPEDITPYLNVLQVASQGADMQAAQTIVGADKMLKAADQFIDRVNAAPHSDLTPNDKRQLADLTFAQVQQMSERARDVMDDAGISAHGHPSAARTEADKAALEDAMVKLKETILKGNVRPEPGEAAAATQEPVEAPDE